MTKETRTIKNCFVAAPRGISLEGLRDSLASRGIRPLIPEELLAGTDWASEIQRQLVQADLVIGILPAGRQSPWVLFELGQAWALGRRILLIASPKSESIPFALQRMLVLRTEPDNRQAIDFALDQLLSAPPEPQAEEHRKPLKATGLGERADAIIAGFDQWLLSGTEQDLENMLSDVLRRSGTDVVVQSAQRDRGADFAVWSDVLEPFVGNPVLVEIKRRILDKKALNSALTQLSSYLAASGTQWALLLYADGPPPDDRFWNKCPPNILLMQIRPLLEALRTKSFPEIVRDLRNRRVHSVRP